MQAAWPYLARWTSALPRMIGDTLSRQQSIGGAETVIPGMGARWEITGQFVIHGEAQELAWQAFIAQMEGGIGTTLVPVWTRFRPKDRNAHPAAWEQTASFSGTQTWEHFGFESVPAVTMALATAAPLRATTIKVTGGNTTGLRPGQYFSIGERLHRVQHHWQDADGTPNLMIQPPLRAAVPAGETLVLDRPVCLMRLAEANGDLEYTPEGASRVSCSFVEAV